MNAYDTLEKSHTLVMQTVDNLRSVQWDVPGAEGGLTVKDIIAHLAAYEQVLVDALNTLQGAAPTPRLEQLQKSNGNLSTLENGNMQYDTAQHVEDAYQDLQIQSTALLAQLPAEIIQRTGTLPWFGSDRSLADLINTIYEYTQKQCEQIALFREEVIRE